MAKLTLTDVSNISGAESTAIATINANWDLIEAALENTLSRDGTTPNTMEASFDLNSNLVLNTDNVLPQFFLQASEPATTYPENSLWIDSDSTDLDVYELLSSVWTDSTVNLKGSTGATGAAGTDGASFQWEDDWVTSTAYIVGDVTKASNDNLYICTVAHTSGASTEPGSGGSWTSYWDLFLVKGTDGAGAGDLVAANNLSDVSSASASLVNLGGQTDLTITDVTTFGATGDGTTDDTTAIQAAFDDVTSKGIIYFPPGIYRTTASITAQDKFLTIYGAGRGSSTILYNGSAGVTGVFDLTRTAVTDVAHYAIRDIGFDTSVAGAGTVIRTEFTGTTGISGNHDTLYMSNVHTDGQGSGYWTHVIEAEKIGGIYVDSCSFLNANSSTAQQDTATACININNSAAGVSVIRALHLVNSYIERYYKCIETEGAGSIESVYTMQTELIGHYGLFLGGSNGVNSAHMIGTHSSCIISNVIVDTGQTVSNLRLIGNDFVLSNNGGSYTTATSVDLDSTALGNIIGINRFSGDAAANGNTVKGISVQNASSQVVITGNQFADFDTGIDFLDTCQDCTYTGNRFASDVTTDVTITTSNASTIINTDSDLTIWAGITPGTNVDTFLATPSSANLAAAITDETGTGVLVFGTSPGFTTAANPASDDGATLGTGALGWSDLYLASGGAIDWDNGDSSISHGTGFLQFNASTFIVSSGFFRSASNDSCALGYTAFGWSDLFLASGAVIDFNSADITLTHAAGLLTGAGGNFAFGDGVVGTTATDGFIYVPTCAGTPTGTPTTVTGYSPIVVDSTNNKLYFYSSSAWRDAGP